MRFKAWNINHVLCKHTTHTYTHKNTTKRIAKAGLEVKREKRRDRGDKWEMV